MKKRLHHDAGGGANGALFQCADLILPYLNPVDLASVSLTCKTLKQISQLITSRRSSDACRNVENVSIPFFNLVDSQSYSYFLYTAFQTRPVPDGFLQPWGCGGGTRLERSDVFLFRVEGANGCECDECDENSGCPCLDSSELLSRECGPSCKCDTECGNRVTQGGIRVKLKIVKDGKKGWGLFADEPIPKGAYVCEYAGELLTTREARKRQQRYDELEQNGRLSPALLVLKEHFSSGNICVRINIDATRIGNVARFINHSCDGGNLDTVIVRSSGALLPRICFFAARDIQEDEELTFSYGDISLNPNGQQCHCGSSSCIGRLPSEHT